MKHILDILAVRLGRFARRRNDHSLDTDSQRNNKGDVMKINYEVWKTGQYAWNGPVAEAVGSMTMRLIAH